MCTIAISDVKVRIGKAAVVFGKKKKIRRNNETATNGYKITERRLR